MVVYCVTGLFSFIYDFCVLQYQFAFLLLGFFGGGGMYTWCYWPSDFLMLPQAFEYLVIVDLMGLSHNIIKAVINDLKEEDSTIVVYYYYTLKL